MLVLGIESSCDETAVAILSQNKNILSNIVSSQVSLHQQYGGVVPEVAARAHLKLMAVTLEQALNIAQIKLTDVSAIAGVIGPGLYGSLLIGSTTAKTLALALNKPFIAVNHLEAHILTPRLLYNIEFPYLALLISGGHTMFVAVEHINKYQILGTTIDDALGEAYDKTARLLGYPYPGGKHIEALSNQGEPGLFKFKSPLYNKHGCNFSFSGLKTAVAQQIHQLASTNSLLENAPHIAKAFEETILITLSHKTQVAIQQFTQQYGKLNNFIVSGGVAANLNIRNCLQKLIVSQKANFYAPSAEYCGDNAAMVAWAGLEKLTLGFSSNLNTPVKPNLRIEDNININDNNQEL